MKPSCGNTLIELLIGVVIMALLACFATPSFRLTYSNYLARTELNKLYWLLSFSQASAYSLNVPVIVCLSADGIHCSGQGRLGVIAFTDAHHSHIANSKTLLYTLTPPRQGTLSLLTFPHQNFIQFNAMGNSSNGSVQYCPKDHNPHASHALIINVTGRVRISQDTDADGIDENANGQALRC